VYHDKSLCRFGASPNGDYTPGKHSPHCWSRSVPVCHSCFVSVCWTSSATEQGMRISLEVSTSKGPQSVCLVSSTNLNFVCLHYKHRNHQSWGLTVNSLAQLLFCVATPITGFPLRQSSSVCLPLGCRASDLGCTLRLLVRIPFVSGFTVRPVPGLRVLKGSWFDELGRILKETSWHNRTSRGRQKYVCRLIFEVFTAVTMKNGIFWDVTPCGSCKNRRFGGT
jgi:hypothetical protein